MDWSEPIRAADIDQQVLQQIPKRPGVYIWRRCLARSTEPIESPDALLTWLKSALSQPFVKSRRISLTDDPTTSTDRYLRPRFVSLDGITIGGGELSSEKLETVKTVAGDVTWRRDFYLHLSRTVDQFGPVLYVGEATSLRDRISTHCTGQSRFATRINRLGLEQSSVSVQYCVTPDLSESERRLLEQCLTHILAAPLTMRAG